jgi:hypothetical protein
MEQQLPISVESPQLLAAIIILVPLAKAKYRELSGPGSSGRDPRIAALINRRGNDRMLDGTIVRP